MLLDHADFAMQELAENNLMVAFSYAWYNGSYTMTARPIKSLELHYTMIQFWIIIDKPLQHNGHALYDKYSFNKEVEEEGFIEGGGLFKFLCLKGGGGVLERGS